MQYAELHLHTEYSFLDGAGHIDDLIKRASRLGIGALAMTDHDNVCAAVKFADRCKGFHIRPIFGAEVTMEDDSHLTLLAQNRDGYANLCRLLTLSRAHGGRLEPHLPWKVLETLTGGLICLSGCRRGRISRLVREHRYPKALAVAKRLQDWFGPKNFVVELQDDFTPGSLRICRDLVELAGQIGAEVAATNNVHFVERDDFVMHDVMRCIAAGITVTTIHPTRPMNDERYLKGHREMARIFSWCPEAVANTVRIAERCECALPDENEVTPKYPHGDAVPTLRDRTERGARERYGRITPEIQARIDHELNLIGRLGFPDYFLMVHDIVLWTRTQGIRCTGRGSAADSCVAYCLHLTDIDVIRRNLPFERFLAEGKIPDIDMDFPSDRRDEVFHHILDTYGEGHVARVCTFPSYWGRGAIRDIGKVLAMPAEILMFLSKHLSHFADANDLDGAFDHFPELRPHQDLRSRLGLFFDLCARIAGFPRHLSSHSSGVVISRVRLDTIAPLQESATGVLPIWTLDKDDSEKIGAIKFDVLALQMLAGIGHAERNIKAHDESFVYEEIPAEDAATFDMIRAGKAVGTFQFESPAQLALAVTLLPKTFEHLVASVALIRPGPIHGHVVSRFVDATRNGWTRLDCLHHSLADVLEKTYGCVVYQEQANHVIGILTGMPNAEADRFRKSLSAHARKATLEEARRIFVDRAVATHTDLTRRRANMIFDQIEGWAGFGFIEGHAASFALTGYRSAYLSQHHAAEYFAGLMNQPTGFYSANTFAAEARRRGVSILPLDINQSDDTSYAPDVDSIQLGLRLVAGMTPADIENILEARRQQAFSSLLDFCIRVPMHRDRLENLVLSGAFDSLHPHRRGLLFGLDQTLGLALSYRAQASSPQLAVEISIAEGTPTPVVTSIDDFSEWERYLWTWRIVGVTAECHVFAHLRERLERDGCVTTEEAQREQAGAWVRVAGLNIRPHRPPTRSGRPVLFTSLEDEKDILQCACFGESIDRCTPAFLVCAAVIVEGRVQRRGKGASLLVEHVEPLSLKDIVVRTEIGRSQSRPVAHPR